MQHRASELVKIKPLNHLNIRQTIWFKKVLKAVRILITAFGIIMLLTFVLSFTDIPFWQYYWLGTHNSDLTRKPDYIVILSGSGMPSPDGLIKAYVAAGAWKQTPDSKIIVAIPKDTTNEFGSPEIQIMHELIMRGVDSTAVLFEPYGYNTITQASNIASFFKERDLDSLSVRLITTPEHMFRSVLVFKNVGFKYVGGSPVFETAIKEKKLIKEEQETGGLDLRYNVWSYMQYEIKVVREYVALIYYKLRGWI